MEFNQELNDQKENEENNTQNTSKQWLQDNLRIIISVLVVVLIAGGIYSYSKRTQAPTGSQEPTLMSEEDANNSGQIDQGTDETTDQSNQAQEMTKENPVQEKTSPATPTTVSQETETSFIETAQKGDGTTKLARAALANFLEKNPDSEITAEHKIYIEDYLRKNVNYDKKVYTGTSMEFPKELIKTAISSSKNLNQKQLQNLHKYVLRVSSLS